jgi:hypothetical protein
MRIGWKPTTILVMVCLWLAALGLQASTVAANAVNAWNPGPGASGDDTYAGFIDTPTSGATVTPNSMITISGWAVDQTAVGWSGIDDVQVYLGQQDQGGTLLVHGNIGVKRDDVASATGNSYWANSGFTASFSETGLSIGGNLLTVYIHTPDKGSWYKQLQLTVPAPPDRPFADDPLLVVRTADPSLDVAQNTPQLVLAGYAIDRNMPPNLQLGVGGSGVSVVMAYLDGPRNGGAGAGTFVGNATLGQQFREATGFGSRFLNSGWQLTLHPNDLAIDRHALYIYAESAYWPNEALVIVPFNVH